MSHRLCKSPIRLGRYAGAGLLLVALMLCAGCGQGEAVVGEKLSTIFPSDLAIYPDAKTPEGAAAGEVSQLTTPDPSSKVVDFYKDSSRNNGWEHERTVPMGPTGARVIIKKDDRTATLTITSGRGAGGAPQTTVELTVR